MEEMYTLIGAIVFLFVVASLALSLTYFIIAIIAGYIRYKVVYKFHLNTYWNFYVGRKTIPTERLIRGYKNLKKDSFTKWVFMYRLRNIKRTRK